MVKLHKKVVSACLATVMAVSTIGTAVAANVSDISSQTPAETVGKYATNPIGTGKRATITIDGSHSDWSEDMLIAQGAAWDVANRYKGAHENCLLDCYSLYAAWDDNNLYIGWQMVNSTDTWAREGDGPLSDGGRIGDVPMVIALSVDPSNPTLTCKNTNGGSIWGERMGFSFETHCDMMLLMSGKVGNGSPALFKVADAAGNTSYDAEHCLLFSSNGIEYAMEEGFMPSELWMIDGLATTPEEEIYGGTANYVDALTMKHNTKYDSFYEIKIPFTALGIDAAYLESNGIGVMQLASRGESALDCLPHDPSMLDNALGEYGKDDSTSHEKDDDDVITVPFAVVGGSGEITTTPQPTDPQPTDPQPTDPQPTDPQPTDPQPTDPQPTDPQPTDPQPTDPSPSDHTYRVAGVSELCGSFWSATDDANLMTYNSATGRFEKTYTNVAAGSYGYKITADGSTWIPDGTGNEQILTVSESGSNVTIWFKESTKEYGAEISAAPTDPQPTDPQPTDPQPSLILGDVSLDGNVQLLDAIMIQKSLVTGKNFTGDALKCADVDKNGKVQLLDAIIVQRYALGLLTNNVYGVGGAIS